MTASRISLPFIALLGASGVAGGCGGDSTSPGSDYDPEIPAAWAPAVTNRYFPLAAGAVFQFEGQTAGGFETNRVEVLPDTRTVNGVAATVVHDRVYLDGELIEDTFDWYAQDAAGNVWYLGEDSKEVENGQVVSTGGSWEWGVNGALPGMIMWADPAAHVGESYRQEFSRGVAEDRGRVVAVGQHVEVPYGQFADCIQTEDTSDLEAGVLENKYYCPDVGNVLEVAGASGERTELTGVTTH